MISNAAPSGQSRGLPCQIDCDLVRTVEQNVTIDWTLRENARTQLRICVKRILSDCGLPPDKQERATRTVLKQAQL